MAVIEVGEVLEITAFCAADDQLGLNMFHFHVFAVDTPGTTFQNIADYVDLDLSNAYKPIISEDAFWLGVSVKSLSRPQYAAQIANANKGPGTGGVGLLPKQICGLISWRTILAGRSFRGRTYLPFPSPDADGGVGQPTTTYVEDCGDVRDYLKNTTTIGGSLPLAGITGYFGVYSRISAEVEPFTAGMIRAEWATQRRRGDFGRPNTPFPL